VVVAGGVEDLVRGDGGAGLGQQLADPAQQVVLGQVEVALEQRHPLAVGPLEDDRPHGQPGLHAVAVPLGQGVLVRVDGLGGAGRLLGRVLAGTGPHVPGGVGHADTGAQRRGLVRARGGDQGEEAARQDGCRDEDESAEHPRWFARRRRVPAGIAGAGGSRSPGRRDGHPASNPCGPATALARRGPRAPSPHRPRPLMVFGLLASPPVARSAPVDDLTGAVLRAVTGAPGSVADAALTTQVRDSDPVVLTGAQVPTWAAAADVALGVPDLGGARCQGNREIFGDTPLTPDELCTNNTYEDQLSTQDLLGAEGTPIDRILGYRWTDRPSSRSRSRWTRSSPGTSPTTSPGSRCTPTPTATRRTPSTGRGSAGPTATPTTPAWRPRPPGGDGPGARPRQRRRAGLHGPRRRPAGPRRRRPPRRHRRRLRGRGARPRRRGRRGVRVPDARHRRRRRPPSTPRTATCATSGTPTPTCSGSRRAPTAATATLPRAPGSTTTARAGPPSPSGASGAPVTRRR
jgi:hypothetical protein